MHLTQMFAAFCFSSLVLAHGSKQGAAGKGRNGTAKAATTDSKCNEISRLTKLADLANNATRLSELESKRNLTATQIGEIKAAAANATTRLTELNANTTLVSQCAVVNADKDLKSSCRALQRLTRLANLANNATALSDLQTKRNLTVAQLDEIRSQAANATTELQDLKSNTTLTSACQTLQSTSTHGGKKNRTGEATPATSTIAAAAAASAKAHKEARSMASGSAGLYVLANGLFAAGVSVFAVLLMA